MRVFGIIVVVLFAGCSTPKILTDGVKYERQVEFKQYLDTAFAGHAYRWCATDGAKAVTARNITDYYATPKGTAAFDKNISGYFVARIKLVAVAIIGLAAVISALVGGIRWLRKNVTLKNNGNSSS